jgi:DEAD/DEAH box helicase domain-containing protein
MRIVCWDLEIAKPIPLKNGKPDWDYARAGDCGISCVVLYDSQTERYHLYDMHNLPECVAHLNSADLIVGYNSIEFDTSVLQNVSGSQLTAPQYDILSEIWRALGHYQKGYKLGDVCGRALNLEKSGSGESAPSLAAQGRWAELMDYCLNDVALTKALYNYVVDEGGILDVNGHMLKLKAPPDGEFC